jgi:hypothetical protein
LASTQYTISVKQLIKRLFASAAAIWLMRCALLCCDYAAIVHHLLLCCRTQASAVVGEYQLMFREALADGQAREMQCGVLQARAAAAEAEVCLNFPVTQIAVTHCRYKLATMKYSPYATRRRSTLPAMAHGADMQRRCATQRTCCYCRTAQHAYSYTASLYYAVRLESETGICVTVVFW